MDDLATDLVIAWMFLDVKSRSIFQDKLNLDDNTWHRAKGWTLWKVLIFIG